MYVFVYNIYVYMDILLLYVNNNIFTNTRADVFMRSARFAVPVMQVPPIYGVLID